MHGLIPLAELVFHDAVLLAVLTRYAAAEPM